MKKITRETLAASAAARWREQYRYRAQDRHQQTGRALKKLGQCPTPDDVDEVIGNDSWTQVPTCSECRKDPTDFVVEVGEKEDYESRTAFLCGACIGELAKFSLKDTIGEAPK